MDSISACQPYQTEVLKTKTIKIPTAKGIVEYQYITEPKKPTRFFEYRPELRAYVEIFSAHPAYESLVESLSSS
jgi:hypothetical protein